MKTNINKVVHIVLLAGFFGVLIAVATLYFQKNELATAQSIINIAGKTLRIEFVDTMSEKETGLAKYAQIHDDFGMVFVFTMPGKYGFWMKDMHFPIDIIWIGEDMTVVHIERDISPDSYPKIFYPNTDALYVLETKAGFSQKQNLKLGDPVSFSG
ncbi:MAG: DUF192 domain-containing protein [Candidatus Pacebacteria bacterium]|jgi:hypothetical protein|nr:DUF192 domain-containing protein [Candidatus Paceibacterota bacterium]